MTPHEQIEKAYHAIRGQLLSKAKRSTRYLPVEAEDLLQDALLRALKAFPGGSQAQAENYLWRALSTTAIDTWRKHQYAASQRVYLENIDTAFVEGEYSAIEWGISLEQEAKGVTGYEEWLESVQAHLHGTKHPTNKSRLYRIRHRFADAFVP